MLTVSRMFRGGKYCRNLPEKDRTKSAVCDIICLENTTRNCYRTLYGSKILALLRFVFLRDGESYGFKNRGGLS